MARRDPPESGNITLFKADSEFLGAEDIIGRGPVRIRIDAVLTYPKGYKVAGVGARAAFPVVAYSRRARDGSWVIGTKRWIISSKAVKNALTIRAESVHAPHWKGMEVDIHVEAVQSPRSRTIPTWGIRVIPIGDEKGAKLWDKMQRAADRLPPSERETPEPDDQPPEPPEPPLDAEDQENYGDIFVGEDE